MIDDRKTRAHIFFYMNRGKERREAILNLLKEFGSFSINQKYCPIIGKDSDLQHLLKKGKIYTTRVHESRRHAKTIIKLTQKGLEYVQKEKERT